MLGWVVLTAVALSAAAVDAATLNKRARLREGPSKETRLLGWVEDGTAVTIEGQRSGWYAVRAPDGQTGYVWKEHLRFDPGEEAAPAVTTVTTPQATAATPTTGLPATFPPTTVATTATTRPATTTIPRTTTTMVTLPAVPPTTLADVRPVPDGRPDPNVAGELERLRGEVTRLAAAQQDLLQRLGRGGGTHDGGSAPPPPMGSDGTAGAAVLFFGGGAVVGWLFGRFGPGRRERRTRLRL
jgi:hypothetical protein